MAALFTIDAHAAATWNRVLTNLASPVDITHAGDGSGRLFVAQQGGRIRVIKDGVLQATPFLDLGALTAANGEQGLLGIAFHPQYATNGRFVVNYTRAGDGATVIARYTASVANPDGADPASAVILLTIAQPYGNHNGGAVKFGPDGFLYIGMGDGGSANDPEGRAQDRTSLLGKLLRIDIDGGTPYAIPPGNPWANGTGGRAEIFALGLRNPWRMSFDRVTGDFWTGDVGQGAQEEIDFLAAGTGAGANFGWRVVEGTSCTGLAGPVACNSATLTAPVITYSHNLGCSVTGGFVYRGTEVPSLAGRYVYGDFCSGRLWAATRNGAAWTAAQLGDTAFGISAFGEDEAGELYFADYGSGSLYKFAETPVEVVEFYHAGFDHYFISSLPADIAAVDSGQLKGWARTGQKFNAYAAAGAGTSPVCRYYIPPAVGDSHFFSASPAECAEVRARFPSFTLETSAAMHLYLPDGITGACPAGTVPVYRLWNGRVDSNHRYVTLRSLRDAMLAKGHVAEGYGPDGVAMCAI